MLRRGRESSKRSRRVQDLSLLSYHLRGYVHADNIKATRTTAVLQGNNNVEEPTNLDFPKSNGLVRNELAAYQHRDALP